MKNCNGDGNYVVWVYEKDPAFVCEKHLGEVTLAILHTRRSAPVKVAIASCDDAPCQVADLVPAAKE